ncbi:monovalent cation/H+ antiporter complex subunit F [Azohydromonas aeria]|uniref:monovalent cation/H+ antiporter complex subunit F n=1 Tax=Azohydromonas aeria TaxID=2590212 RepID=UPI0018DEF7FA|nr:monovalent cation/H+ antiporter complex subunit F [Azohydromonas aeria]
MERDVVMAAALEIFLVFLLLNLAAGLVRAYRGPTASDRISAVLLFGSTMVAVLLVLAQLHAEPALRDVALLFVMLAAVLSVAFAGLPTTPLGDADDPSPGEGPTPGPDGGAPPSPLQPQPQPRAARERP